MPKDYKRKKKRTFSGNRYGAKPTKKVRVDNVSDSTHTEASTSNTGLNTSARKIGSHNILSSSKGKTTNASGYRFIDLEILYEFVTHEVCCKLCGESSLVLEDNEHGRKGCVSHLRARCISCGWAYTFHTSKKQGYAFDANKRFVYAMRSLGKGHAAAKRFCALMNMPPPPQPTAYRACNIALAKAAKTVAVKTMKDAANEFRNNQLKEVNQCAVSCDGTWQRRGHRSMNGCVTTLSMENGKCLDVEVLSEVCHGCRRIEREVVMYTQFGVIRLSAPLYDVII